MKVYVKVYIYIYIYESIYKNGKTIIKFDDIKMPKQKFYQHKGAISIKNADIDKIIVSNKVPFGKKGFKNFIGYKDAKKNKPLCVFLPKMTAYRKDFDETMYLFC